MGEANRWTDTRQEKETKQLQPYELLNAAIVPGEYRVIYANGCVEYWTKSVDKEGKTTLQEQAGWDNGCDGIAHEHLRLESTGKFVNHQDFVINRNKPGVLERHWGSVPIANWNRVCEWLQEENPSILAQGPGQYRHDGITFTITMEQPNQTKDNPKAKRVVTADQDVTQLPQYQAWLASPESRRSGF